mmetsp:Transcript_42051/g.40320  ORF Transcript_42051/g.40320 Transcript_42051/m.40320 type:complete len:81 (-) Transcript_42051:1511-1753(-)
MTPIHVKNDTSRPDWPLKGFDTFLISEGPNDKSIIKASRSQQLVVRAECNVLHRSFMAFESHKGFAGVDIPYLDGFIFAG